MTAGGGVDVLAVMADALRALKIGAAPAAKIARFIAARAAIAELLAADREYDEARAALKVAQAIHGEYSPHSDLHAAYKRLHVATARRASALAALEGDGHG